MFKGISSLLKKKKVIFVILIIIIITLAGKQFFISNEQTLESTTIKRGSVKEELTLSGKVEADEHVNLQFQTVGQLSWIGVKEGDKVQKNQLIATLDQRQLQKTLEKYLSTYQETRLDLNKTRDTYKDSPISETVRNALYDAQSSLDKSILDVELQNISMQYANLLTPIEGIIAHVETPFAGINVLPTQPLFEVVNPKTIYFDVSADQTEVVKLTQGKIGTIFFDSYPDEKTTGIINNISLTPKKDETGTVYDIKIKLNTIDNSNYKYRIGMTGDVTFTTKQKNNVFYLPVKFIKSDDNGQYIILGTKKEKTYIQTGLEGEENTEIKGNIKEGDVVYD